MKWSLLFLLTLPELPSVAQQAVRYELSFPNAVHHEVEVRATFSGVRQPVLEVVMSRSSPGRYALHEFAKNVYRLSAQDSAGKPLEITRPSAYQWNIQMLGKDTVTVQYTLFGDHADGTYAGIDAAHAHLNLPATLAWAHGFEQSPSTVKVNAPAKWQVFTQLPQNDGSYTAPNLDRLMDGPMEIGPGTAHNWTVGGARFRMALHHQGTAEEGAAFAQAVQAITAEEEGVFGAFPKYDDGLYTFLLDYLPYVHGDGMEHRNSTSITSTRNLADSTSELLDTVAHEFFHSWNVKRIRPKTLQPFDFERTNISGELWFAEGFTNYYGPLTLKRAGIWNQDQFTNDMARAVNTVLTAPGRQLRSPVEMSRMAPFVDAAAAVDSTNTRNTYISYYTYGQALALGIDLSIRSQFPGKSLDDWMRAMWHRHPDADRPYTLDDLQQALAEVTNANFAAGIFERHIHGREPMDYKTLLAHAGFALENAATGKAWLGRTAFTIDEEGAKLTDYTLRGSPLYDAGLDRGDRILDWDGKAIRSQLELDQFLATHKPGDRIALTAQTRSEKKTLELVLGSAPELRVVDGKSTPETIAFREDWLSSKAKHAAPAIYKYCPLCKRKHPFEYEKCPYDGSALHITPGK